MDRIKEISADKCAMYIYGDISDWNWGEDTNNSASAFVKDFLLCENKYKNIDIHINSLGGSIVEGLPIFNAIAQSKANTTCINDGVAMSMGAVVLMAGKKVKTCKNSITMFHSASSMIIGTAQDLRKEADTLDVFNGALAECILSKCKRKDACKKTKQDILNAFFDYSDHFLSAEEMIKEGYADETEQEEANFPKEVKDISINNISARYKEVENAYKNAYGEQRENIFQKLINKARNLNNYNTKTEKEMDTTELAKMLGLTDKASEQEITDKVKYLLKNQKEEEPKQPQQTNNGTVEIDLEKMKQEIVDKVMKDLGAKATEPTEPINTAQPTITAQDKEKHMAEQFNDFKL